MQELLEKFGLSQDAINDVMAYIPSLRVHREGGYEGGGSNIYYGLPGLWDEGAEEAIFRAVHDLSGKEK